MQGRALLIAASTHEGEDAIVAEAHCQLRRTIPDLCTIIAPRHPERGAGDQPSCSRARGSAWPAARSARLPDRTSDAYIADTIGELGMLYKLAPVAFIGGSLVDRGGQNPIEAVRQGAAVLTGPHWQNFSDTYKALISQRARDRRPLRAGAGLAAGRLLADQTELGRMHSARQHRVGRAVGCAASHGGGTAAAAAGRRRFRACLLTSRPGGIAIAPGGMAACLTPLASVYGWVATTRYARAEPYRSRLPVICAGNFTAGGTGKTPLVMHLCERLQADGQHPVALTRGYGGRHAGPHWVSDARHGRRRGRRGPAARPLGADAGRPRSRCRGHASSRQCRAQPDVIVMDDGLQNPSLAKDLAIAMVDGSRGLGNGLVIPAGPLRAPLDFQLGLADAIVVNGAGARRSTWPNGCDIGSTGRCCARPPSVAGDVDWLQGRRVVAWAGIASPQRFFAMLKTQGAEVVEHVIFRDHQRLDGRPMPNVFSPSLSGSRPSSSARRRTWHASRARPENLPNLPRPRGSLQIRLSFCRTRCRAAHGHDRQCAQGTQGANSE